MSSSSSYDSSDDERDLSHFHSTQRMRSTSPSDAAMHDSQITNSNTNDDNPATKSITDSEDSHENNDNIVVDKWFDSCHKCDICDMHDGYNGMNMQQCKSCQIYVHECCYCLKSMRERKKRKRTSDDDDSDGDDSYDDEFVKYTDWQCFACAAVGDTVKSVKTVMIQKVPKEIETVAKIETRPTVCSLCSCATKEMHAMHPLYDIGNENGQPRIKATDKSTLWVHTICAFSINTSPWTAGLVYGCGEHGELMEESDSDEEEQSDDNQITADACKNSFYDFRHYVNGKVVLMPAVHHFVITSKEDAASNKALTDLKDSRSLICFVCARSDKISDRIAVQCHDDECIKACHIGCAKWASKSKYELIAFSPVSQVATLYCEKHARQKLIKKKDSSEKVATKKMKKLLHNKVDESDIFDCDSSDDSVENENQKLPCAHKRGQQLKRNKNQVSANRTQAKRARLHSGTNSELKSPMSPIAVPTRPKMRQLSEEKTGDASSISPPSKLHADRLRQLLRKEKKSEAPSKNQSIESTASNVTANHSLVPGGDIPPNYGGSILLTNPNDVICGPGKKTDPGSIQYQELLGQYISNHPTDKIIKADKEAIAAKLVATIRSMHPPGRFLCKGPLGWSEIGDEKARKKVFDAIREARKHQLHSEQSQCPGVANRKQKLGDVHIPMPTSSSSLPKQESPVAKKQMRVDDKNACETSKHPLNNSPVAAKKQDELTSKSQSNVIQSRENVQKHQLNSEQSQYLGVAKRQQKSGDAHIHLYSSSVSLEQEKPIPKKQNPVDDKNQTKSNEIMRQNLALQIRLHKEASQKNVKNSNTKNIEPILKWPLKTDSNKNAGSKSIMDQIKTIKKVNFSDPIKQERIINRQMELEFFADSNTHKNDVDKDDDIDENWRDKSKIDDLELDRIRKRQKISSYQESGKHRIDSMQQVPVKDKTNTADWAPLSTTGQATNEKDDLGSPHQSSADDILYDWTFDHSLQDMISKLNVTISVRALSFRETSKKLKESIELLSSEKKTLMQIDTSSRLPNNTSNRIENINQNLRELELKDKALKIFGEAERVIDSTRKIRDGVDNSADPKFKTRRQELSVILHKLHSSIKKFQQRAEDYGEKKIDPNITFCGNLSLLHAAVFLFDMTLIKNMLELGVNASTESDDWGTVVDLARSLSNQASIRGDDKEANGYQTIIKHFNNS